MKKEIIEKVVRTAVKYTGKDGQVKTAYEFKFVLIGGSEILFAPYRSNFADVNKNFDTFKLISDMLVDEYITVDKTKKEGKK